MPTLVMLGSVKIQIFADDHHPPHFHASSPDHDILIAISDFQIVAGQMRARDLRAVLTWAADNRQRLQDEWTRLNQR
ncbi:DUF4160 domain-containing protein [Rhizobium sp. Leaf371]|uniref:DUF4160 domain-containing protein n=1 Tax=Rhizobium sp. Leaf371 TaxID=1736355 RepID=UPI000B266E75|nr:DUF4160 domain-containing protein [Rhizobium sp. Leaf371]